MRAAQERTRDEAIAAVKAYLDHYQETHRYTDKIGGFVTSEGRFPLLVSDLRLVLDGID